MNPTFTQMARCFAAYQDLDSAFWPFVHHVQAGDEVHNDPVASAEAMRRMLAITMADVYGMVRSEDLSEMPVDDLTRTERIDLIDSFRSEFLRKANVDISHPWAA